MYLTTFTHVLSKTTTFAEMWHMWENSKLLWLTLCLSANYFTFHFQQCNHHHYFYTLLILRVKFWSIIEQTVVRFLVIISVCSNFVLIRETRKFAKFEILSKLVKYLCLVFCDSMMIFITATTTACTKYTSRLISTLPRSWDSDSSNLFVFTFLIADKTSSLSSIVVSPVLGPRKQLEQIESFML